MRDLQELRQFITGGPVSLPIDAAFAPLFLAILVLLHPAYAVVASVATALMMGMGLWTEVIARRPAALANDAALKSHAEVAAAIRNAEVIEAMGMRDAIVERWQRGQNRALALIGIGNAAPRRSPPLSRSLRMGLQVVMLATGATLVIDHAASPGSMIAASIIMGRLLFPFEQMIDGWRQWTHAISAWSRLRTLLAGGIGGPQQRPRRGGRRAGFSVEGVTFVPPDSDRPILRTCASPSSRATCWASSVRPAPASRRWRACWSVSGGRRRAASISTVTTSTPGSGPASARRSATCRRTPSCSTAPCARTSPASPMPTPPRSSPPPSAPTSTTSSAACRWATRRGSATAASCSPAGSGSALPWPAPCSDSPKLLVLDEPNANVDSAGEQALLHTLREAKKVGTTVIVIAHRMSVMAAPTSCWCCATAWSSISDSAAR